MHAPKETDGDRKLTEQLIERIKPDTVRRNIYIGLPGSELYQYSKENDLVEFTDKNESDRWQTRRVITTSYQEFILSEHGTAQLISENKHVDRYFNNLEGEFWITHERCGHITHTTPSIVMLQENEFEGEKKLTNRTR